MWGQVASQQAPEPAEPAWTHSLRPEAPPASLPEWPRLSAEAAPRGPQVPPLPLNWSPGPSRPQAPQVADFSRAEPLPLPGVPWEGQWRAGPELPGDTLEIAGAPIRPSLRPWAAGQDSLVLVLEEIPLLQTLVHPARGKESGRESVLPDQLQRLGRQQSGDAPSPRARRLPPPAPRGPSNSVPVAPQPTSRGRCSSAGKEGSGPAGGCRGAALTCCLSRAVPVITLSDSQRVERIFSYWINLFT